MKSSASELGLTPIMKLMEYFWRCFELNYSRSQCATFSVETAEPEKLETKALELFPTLTT